MVDVVDSIVAELEVRLGNYVANFTKAAEAHERFTKTRPDKVGQFSTAEVEKYANRHKQAGDVVVQASDKAARATKKRSADEIAAEKAAAAAAKAAAKERAQAAKEAARAEAEAQKQAQRASAERAAQESRLAQVVNQQRRQEIETLNRLREAERQATAQVNANSFLTSRGLSGKSARSSADVFKDQFRVEAQEAKQAAAAEAALAKERDAAGAAAAQAAAKEAERDANAARRVIHENKVTPAAGGGSIGATVPRETSGQRSIPASVLAGGGAAAEEDAVNHLLADRFDLAQRAKAAEGGVKRELADQVDYLRRIDAYKRAGLAEDEAILRAEKEQLAVQRLRSSSQRGGTVKGAEQFARGAGFSAATGGAAAIAGIGTAAAVYGGIQAVESGINYAKEIADTAAAVGVSTRQLQVYQAAARDAGVTNEQLRSSFGQLNSYLGRAQEGDEQAAKTFKALGINIRDAAGAGDILPTLVDRISSIEDPAKRAAIETRLFGEEGRRLDALLSGGTGKIDALTRSLEAAGSILSQSDIDTLKAADNVLARLKQQLEVDLSRVVAGNAQAILGLASAFVQLADKALRAINTISRLKAQNVFNGVGPSGIFAATPEERAAARDRLIADPQGRQFLLQQNSRELASNRQQRAALGRTAPVYMTVDGKRVLNTDYYNSERSRLLAERRQVLTYRDAADVPVAVQGGKVDQKGISSLFAPKPPKGRKGKSAEQLEAEAEAREKRYQDQLAALQEANLRAEQQATGSIERRADIEVQLADRALAKQLADIESTRKTNVLRGADSKLEAAHAAELAAAARLARNTEVANIGQQRQADLIEAANQHLQTRLAIDSEILSSQAQLATTAKERRRLELLALDNQKKQERGDLETQLRTLKPDDPRRTDVQQRLGRLDEIYKGREANVRQGTESPLEAYRRQLHEATDDTNAALERVEVEGLQGLEDQIGSTIGKVLGLKGAFGGLVASILTDLAKIEIEKGILSFLGDGAGGGGGGGGGFLGSLLSGLGHHAAGGNVVGGVPIVVGENGRETFVPAQTGRIVPNNSPVASGRGGDVKHYHISVNAENSVTPEGFAAGLARQILSEADRMDATRQGSTLGQVPGRIQRLQTLGS